MPKSIGAIGRGGFGWLLVILIKNKPKPTKTNHPLGLLNSPKISQDFFQPPFLMPELEDRVTVKVENMRKTADLPHMCEKQQIWTQMKSNLMEGNLLESATTKGYHSTGRWGLQRKEKCHPEKTCLVCGTAPLDEAPPKDQ